jgi:hypothetical protein
VRVASEARPWQLAQKVNARKQKTNLPLKRFAELVCIARYLGPVMRDVLVVFDLMVFATM